jgi:hypothetical protein
MATDDAQLLDDHCAKEVEVQVVVVITGRQRG